MIELNRDERKRVCVPTEPGYYWAKITDHWAPVELQRAQGYVTEAQKYCPGACVNAPSGFVVHILGQSTHDYPTDGGEVAMWGPRLGPPTESETPQ